METVNIKINNRPITVSKELTILEAAKQAKIEIPTLCYLKQINQIGACRICVVEVKGARTLVAACTYPVAEGMEVFTDTPKVHESRRMTLELILSNHDRKCLSCVRSGNCELQRLCKQFGVDDEVAFEGVNPRYDFDDSAMHMTRDNNKCILCRRCVAACSRQQAVGVIGSNDRGFDTHIGCAFDLNLDEVACVSCGQCIVVCPTGAIAEKDETQKVWDAINDPTKHVVVQTAPSIRATIGEEFGFPIGTDATGKMVAALRRLGFDGVYDTDFAADLTIVEEANELLERVTKGGPLPLITSCSPGWIKFCEHYYPEFIPNLSSCKSPQQMFGAIFKTWYAETHDLDPKDLFVVGVMPCTAKKFEVNREDENAAGVPDCDVALTTREIARMIKRAGIEFTELEDEYFDDPLGESTGASVIFGATGGVMEAALRTAVVWLEKEDAGKIEFVEVRGFEGVKEATYNVAGMDINVAVASGLSNAKMLLEKVKSGEKQYHFIEIMACPGGCINGGGQPVQSAHVRNFVDLRAKRAQVLYNQDSENKVRQSHENPVIKKLYDEYLDKPGSHRAHEVLHTSYKVRSHY
ncbi:MAG: [FeFe] hydrogenase, group A [Oscillospiraceae bacterium]|jgi:NADP-reducing hydrogenase subunit HndD|nr:[FeFe] hydrogenase, group A [Oscillospiraceae bacterium]